MALEKKAQGWRPRLGGAMRPLLEPWVAGEAVGGVRGGGVVAGVVRGSECRVEGQR